MIENKRKRLEKLTSRQKRELLRLLAFESKSKELMVKTKQRTEEQWRKEAKLRAAKRRTIGNYEERTKELLRQKEELIDIRRKNARMALVERDRLKKELGKVKSWGVYRNPSETSLFERN